MVVAIPQIVIAGLGNIPYPLTRHSVGHRIIDSLASRLGVAFVNDNAAKALTAHTTVAIGKYSVGLTLVKPKPLMNISGPSVVKIVRKTIRSPTSLILIHDSLSHKPLVVSPKFSGSANGHNGVKSVIAALGGVTAFHRLRIGIGEKQGDAADYVMGNLSAKELDHWAPKGDGSEAVWRAIEKIVQQVVEDG